MECPFCNKKLLETKGLQKPCCDHPNLINDSHIVCTYCDAVNDYLTANEFVDVYISGWDQTTPSMLHYRCTMNNNNNDNNNGLNPIWRPIYSLQKVFDNQFNVANLIYWAGLILAMVYNGSVIFFGELETAVSVLDTEYSHRGGSFSTVQRSVPARGMVARSLQKIHAKIIHRLNTRPRLANPWHGDF